MGDKLNLTTILALWGAVISTILAFLKVREFYREDKPRIKVTVAGGYYVLPKNHPKNPYGDKPLISITAVNIGRRPVTLKKAGLLRPRDEEKKKYLLSVDSVTTIELTEGKSHDYHLLEDEIENKGITSNRYVAFVIDGAGRYYWSHNILTRFLKLRRIK
jgi:hypothetical protein